MRTRSSRWILVLVVLAVIMAACGGSEDNDDTTGSEPSADEGEPTSTDGTEEGDAGEASDEVADLSGRTMTIAVPNAPGGGFDAYARMFAPYFEEELGVTAVVSNEPGGGGNITYNRTENTAADELRVQVVSAGTAIISHLGEAEGVEYDPSEWSFIGRISSDPQLVAVGADSGYETFEDLLNSDRPARFGSTGPGSTSDLHASVLDLAYGVDIDIIRGFEGSTEGITSVLRGDTDGYAVSVPSMMSGINDGDLIPLVIMGTERTDELPDIPAIVEFEAVNPEAENIVSSYIRIFEVQRTLAVGPNVPQDVVNALRQAFDNIMENEEFHARAESEGRDLIYLSGEDTEQIVDDIYAGGEDFRSTMREIIGSE